MAAQEILVRRGGLLSPVKEIWFRNSANLLTRATYAYVVTGTGSARKFVPMFEGTPPPTGLQATAKDRTSVTLKWNAVTGAVKYQIMKRTGAVQDNAPATMIKELTPASGTAWTNRTWKVTGGIATNTDYIFSVRAINATGDISPETNPAIHYYSGRTEHRVTGTKTREFEATNSGTYDTEKSWGRESPATRVAEGFASGSDQKRNRYGCVDYSGVYARIVELDGVGIADHLDITAASIKDIARTNDDKGGNPTMHWHAGRFVINATGSAGKPVLDFTGTDSKDVNAPDEGKNKGAKTDIPLDWAKKWASKAHTTHGLIVYRSDGKGVVIMHGSSGSSFENVWDLTLSYKWNYVDIPDKPPSTETWQFKG